jgi:hypothetical protein
MRLKAESDNIIMAMRAPSEVLPTATEAEKAAAFTSPAVLAHDEAFSVGQPQTVDEVRETFGSTMGNATPDSGLSPELDRRGWLPDLNPLSLTPSR